jgi:hypothetical protein
MREHSHRNCGGILCRDASDCMAWYETCLEFSFFISSV